MNSAQLDRFKTATKQVCTDCLLPNGCFIAAPSHMPYYPKDAKSYLYSWPGRDLGFSLAAMLLLGADHYERTLTWLWERAEDFQASHNPKFTGLIFRSYYPNGLVREHQFQPDQGGTLLWSIYFKKEQTGKDLSEIELKVVNQLAENYKRVWHGEGFDIATEDLWEERGLRPQEGDFTYSLSACAKGIECAYKLTGNTSYLETADSMKAAIAKHCFARDDGIIPRHFGGSLGIDNTIDGSLAGLIWPFYIDYPKENLANIVKRIENEITDETGVYRYPNDKYEGADSIHKPNEKAGSWPLLTFWLSIAFSELGDKSKSEKYFDLVFENLDKDDYFIPEQVFSNGQSGWVGVKPLMWSHAMAVFAAWKLGKL